LELSAAICKANRILDEERSTPTVKYSLRVKELALNDPTGQLVATMLAITNEPELLRSIQSQRPRPVEENPRKWGFESVNYSLLCAVFSQLPADSRQAFLSAVLNRLLLPPGCAKAKWHITPSWNWFISEFPLVAEFCVRHGAKDAFVRLFFELELFQAHAVLLRHLEDMIALNYAVFGDQDYEVLTAAITALGNTARNRNKAHRDSGATGGEAGQFWVEIMEAADGIKEECRKARYLYLKSALLEGLNLEINQDKAAVESYLKAQGFSDGLIGCLNRADQIYQSASSGFEFKSVMGHLRSFMERLQSEGLTKLSPAMPSLQNQKWGDSLKRLRQEGVVSKPEEVYASALYTLLSDEGVHPIIAEKEYARLARNVVIEYALLFLRRLEKLRPKPLRANERT
jgi:hypothetical protein